jgi:hypothetical protein
VNTITSPRQQVRISAGGRANNFIFDTDVVGSVMTIDGDSVRNIRGIASPSGIAINEAALFTFSGIYPFDGGEVLGNLTNPWASLTTYGITTLGNITTDGLTANVANITTLNSSGGNQIVANSFIGNTMVANLSLTTANITTSNIIGNGATSAANIAITAANSTIDMSAYVIKQGSYLIDTKDIGGPKLQWLSTAQLVSSSNLTLGGNATYNSASYRGILLNDGANTRGGAAWTTTYNFTNLPSDSLGNSPILVFDAQCQFGGAADGIYMELGTDNAQYYVGDGSDGGIAIYFDQFNESANGGIVSVLVNNTVERSSPLYFASNYLKDGNFHDLRVVLFRRRFSPTNIGYGVYVYVDGFYALSTLPVLPTNWSASPEIISNRHWGITGWSGSAGGSHWVKSLRITSPQQYVYENPWRVNSN